MVLVVKSCIIIDTPWIIDDRDRIIVAVTLRFVCGHVITGLQCCDFCDFDVPIHRAVFSDHKHVRFSSHGRRLYAPPKQQFVKMFAKCTAY